MKRGVCNAWAHDDGAGYEGNALSSEMCDVQ